MAIPRSNIILSSTKSEVASNVDLDVITDPEFIQIGNSAQLELATILKDNNRCDYCADTMTTPLVPPTAGQDERAGVGVASIAGTPVVFSSPLSGANYALNIPVGIDYLDPTKPDGDPLKDTRTAVGFTAFSAVDGVSFLYFSRIYV